MRGYLAGFALAVLLVGCGQASTNPGSPAVNVPMPEAVTGGEASRAADAPAPPQAQDAVSEERPASPQSPGPQPVMYLAYSYQMALEIPADRLTGVMDAHMRACLSAGPRICQLIGSNQNGDPGSSMSGTVNLRAEPNWLRTFMGGIGAQATAAGGRVTSQATSTEDLTRSIVDTEAHMRAQTALRDRLQEMLRSRPGKLSDLLDVERELARVQGDMDATQSELAVMRTRVAMSELTISYSSSAKAVGTDTFEPLSHAFSGFLGVVVWGFAAIITLIAALLPFAIVIVPIVWAILRWRRGRSSAKTAAETGAEHNSETEPS
ncbi:MAG: DUF4349 domain-containing protein [Terricaulis sp.]